MTLAHNEYAKVVIHSWIRFGWFQQWHVNLIHIFSCYKNHSTLKWPNINSLLGLSFNDLSTSPRLAYTQDNNGVSFTSIEPGQLLLLCKICMCHSFTTKQNVDSVQNKNDLAFQQTSLYCKNFQLVCKDSVCSCVLYITIVEFQSHCIISLHFQEVNFLRQDMFNFQL